ncbi:MAG TPA: carbohydrate kinase [Candidatus Eremiobacteraceae bacterium]|nr:carbohydrate kinase [Candidatus Eremiobacteraceae bacterium]
MSFTLCVGEALIDFVAQSTIGDVGGSELFRRAAGGAVANVAVGIARLGGAAHFAGTLGHDTFGRFLLRTLALENVNVDGVRTVDEHTTLAFVARGEVGARDFFFLRNPGADSQLAPSDISSHELAQARMLHFGGVLLSSDPGRSTCLFAAAAAKQAGALVSFDPNARPALFASSDELKHWLVAGCANAHLVKLSEDDLQELGMQLADAPTLINETTRAVIVSRGARGCHWIDAAGESGDVAAPRVDVVDTTGAGDAMMAAILWRLEQAHSATLSAAALADAARYGCAAGALACLREGAIPALPTAAALEAMLSRVP